MELFGGRVYLGPPKRPTQERRVKPRFAGRKDQQRREFVKTRLTQKEFDEWAKGSIQIPIGKTYKDPIAFKQTFFSALIRHIPTVSAAVWVWKNLASGGQETKYEGGTEQERRRAQEITIQLDRRLAPFPSVQGGGAESLIDVFFDYYFGYGRFAGLLQIAPDGSQVDTFKVINPFDVTFLRPGLTPVISLPKSRSRGVVPNEALFYYLGHRMTTDNPNGQSMLEAAVPFLTIAQDMLTDMALSSANVGTPRLHFKLRQPEPQPNEDQSDYVERVNSYFDDTVGEMAEIGPDENFYTWDDVSIGFVGGGISQGFIWRSNRQTVEEEVLTAFHLPPWALSKSFGTTKNWVMSQFDLILTETESIQKKAQSFIQWIRNVNLLLHGVTTVRVRQSFVRPRDPGAKDMAIAARFKIANAKTKALAGWISSDDAARELGYDKAHDPDRLYKMQKEKEEPINKDDSAEDSTESREEFAEMVAASCGEAVTDRVRDLIQIGGTHGKPHNPA